jgi:alkanesulfonate monooxygenase SsuD/methylene tetrahydromethanopterin reductase-like flavin-dependent oxidoreductase (luciferase family)
MRRVRELGCHLLTSRYSIEDLLRNSILLDEYGYDHIKVGDHVLVANSSANYPNAHVLLAAIGARTKQVRLSTAVTDPFRRHPVEIAHWIATLDQLTQGRAPLGLGAGEVMNTVPYGIELKRPLTRLREAINVIKMLWEASPSNPASYSGEIFTLKNAYLQIGCIQKPHPPVYIGAIGKKTKELAGEVADGWVTMVVNSSNELRGKIQDIERGAGRSGRRDDFDVVITSFTDIDDDPERAYKSVEGAARGELVAEREFLEKRTGLKVPEDLSIQRMDVTETQLAKRVNEFSALIPRELVARAGLSRN